MMQQFGRLALMDEEQTQELKEHSDFTRIEVIKSLGKWSWLFTCCQVRIKQKIICYLVPCITSHNVMNLQSLFITYI